jgi:putative chitinase
MSKENADYLMARAQGAGIVNKDELSNFMGQMQVESAGFSRMTEDLNYSGRRLFQVFQGRNGLDTRAKAEELAASGAEAIANALYGGHWGARNLGNTEPGDGWKFRGRGYVQLTGRANYERIGTEIGIDLGNQPELLEDRSVAAQVAIHYWKTRVIPHGAQLDVAAATKRINGGQNHLAERMVHASEWKQKLDNGYRPDAVIEVQAYAPLANLQTTLAQISRRDAPGAKMIEGMPEYLRVQNSPQGSSAAGELREGRSGPQVRELQLALMGLGVRDGKGRTLAIDGVFGASTRQAVENFQLWNALPTSGVVDQRTRDLIQEPQLRAAAARPGDAADLAVADGTPSDGQLSRRVAPTDAGIAASLPRHLALDPTHASHPDHAMYRRIRAGISAIDEQHGKPYDEASERVSRSLLARCRGASACGSTETGVSQGMALRRVDHVLMGTTGNVFAIEGRLDDPAHRRAFVSAAEAALFPVTESDRLLATANRLGAREQDAERQHTPMFRPHHPAAGASHTTG